MKAMISSHKYNKNISAAANASLSRRAVVVSLQRIALFVGVIFAISFIILFSSTVITFAKSKETKTPVKEYISIQVQANDTIWSIAEEKIEGFSIKRADYINEVKHLNNLSSDQIHTGDFIVVPYYHY